MNTAVNRHVGGVPGGVGNGLNTAEYTRFAMLLEMSDWKTWQDIDDLGGTVVLEVLVGSL